MEINVELISSCLANHRPAQNQLYQVLLPYLNAICQRYLTDQSERSDVLQEAFIRIFKHLSQFDVQRASFKTWATKIMINCCLKANYRNQKRPRQELISEQHGLSVMPRFYKELSDEELLNWLKTMPPQYFECLACT